MDARERARLEHTRDRWLRSDFTRFLKPDWRDPKYWATPPPAWAQHPDDVGFPPAAEASAAEEMKRLGDAIWREYFEIKQLIKERQRELRSPYVQKYNPDQPRVPAGNPDGGEWTSGDGSSGNGAADDGSIELSGQKRRILKEFGDWTARQFISQYCQAKINRQFPGEFDDKTIAEIEKRAQSGDARAKKCMKLLEQRRFRK